MEQQAKERLTGGVILVVLLVLLVPELLTGPRPAPAAAPAQPDQAPMRSYTMDLGESPRTREPVAASTAAAPAREPVATANSAPVTPALAAAPAAVTAASASAPPPRPPSPGLPTAHAAPHAAAEHAASEHASPGWTVQVATFSSRDNAAHLIATLKSHGFAPLVSETTRNGHKLFRVRVGSERDRAAALKLLARLKAAGQKGGEVVPK